MSNITANLSKNLPPLVEKVVGMISAMTGESPNNLATKSLDELFQMLATALQCEKEFVQSLFIEHDQNVELDAVSSELLWKLYSKGVLKEKKTVHGTNTKENFEVMKSFMLTLISAAILRAQRGQAAPRSTTATISGASENAVVVNSKDIFESHTKKAMLNEMIANNNQHVHKVTN